ncbi:MAG TPA: response regulator [Syntrophobacteraceae bacterium]|nr:response regulator [Syntrophobacteraceae bacterium]
MSRNPIRVLLVEDDEEDFMLISELLRQVESTVYLVRKACDFDSAISELKSNFTDVVLLDYLLGAKTGLDILKYMGAMAARPPAILLTSHGDYSVDIEAMKYGAADYIDKSHLRPDVLERCIRYSLERERTETPLGRLSCILNMLRECGFAITRASREDVLYREICRIAVEIGGYRFCWVGLADGHSGLTPVAHAGYEDGYLRAIGISSKGGQARSGPMWTAARNSDPLVVTKIGLDPAFEPWQAEAMKRGYASSITLPFSVQNEFVGTLNIYSGETDAFNEEAVGLLRYLGHQLSLGISYLRNRLELVRAQRALRERVESLRERERYFRSILANMHEDIFVIGRDNRICDVNRQFLETVKRTRKQVVGRLCYQVLRNARGPCLLYGKRCRLEEVFQTGKPDWENKEVVRADGQKTTVNALYSPMRDKTGKVVKGILAARDISYELRLESELRQAQKMEAIGTLAGGIAHDFNNILGIIMGYAQLTRPCLPQESEESSYLAQITDACLRGKEVVKQIMAFSRKSDHEKHPLSLGLILKEALKLLRAVLPSTMEIKLCVKTATGLDLILADATQIIQLIINLSINAADAISEQGGTLEIDLSEISLTSTEDPDFPNMEPGSYLCISFKDTGCGIAPSNIKRIFEPYFSTKGQGRGTGLGLAVVHGIVKDHKGEVKVSSELGKGSVFKVYLPKLSMEPPVVEEDPNVPSAYSGAETILMIDDEKHLLDAYSNLLDNIGYKTVPEADSLKALEAFRDSPSGFDLIITDQTMPKMTGLEVARQVLQIRPDMPIIICSGRDNALNEQSAKAAGIRAFLLKPVLMKDLAEKVREILDESRMSDNAGPDDE